MLSRTIAALSRTLVRSSTTMVNTLPVRHMSSFSTVVPAARQLVKKEIAMFEADLDDCSEDIKDIGAVVSTSNGGVITIQFSKNDVDIALEYNKDFLFHDEHNDFNDAENSIAEGEQVDENVEEGSAYHDIIVRVTNSSGVTLICEGHLELDTTLDIRFFTPVVNGVPMRRMTSADFEEGTVEGYV